MQLKFLIDGEWWLFHAQSEFSPREVAIFTQIPQIKIAERGCHIRWYGFYKKRAVRQFAAILNSRPNQVPHIENGKLTFEMKED